MYQVTLNIDILLIRAKTMIIKRKLRPREKSEIEFYRFFLGHFSRDIILYINSWGISIFNFSSIIRSKTISTSDQIQ